MSGLNRPKGYVMSDTDANALRDLVPDDPIPLPEDCLACEGCGIAVPAPAVVSTSPAPGRERSLPMNSTEFTRCPPCQSIHDDADAYVTAHPDLGRRMGGVIARERIESVLFALAILRQHTPDDLGLLLPRMFAAGSTVRFRSPVTLTRDLCSPRPWAHVTLSQRAALRSAYAEVLRDRLALHEQPVALVCPSRGCLLCGMSAVHRSAIEVARRGGSKAAVLAVWRAVSTAPSALGSNGPERISGHVCPQCAEAVDAEGAIGPTARGRAVVAHVRFTLGDSKAARLRSMLIDDYPPPPLPAWGALRLPPNRQPWSHLVKVMNRL